MSKENNFNYSYLSDTNFLKFRQIFVLILIGLLSLIGVLCKENAIMIMVSLLNLFSLLMQVKTLKILLNIFFNFNFSRHLR